ncbi:hypothetical protein BGY98DRAFT_974219 [Russula aff. rugulosa BPL654]|nr:hypothetical protein BGY98DRAFT_974219 [Russula aff. rugulosa BPL654]
MDALIPRVETCYDVRRLTTTFLYLPEQDGVEQDSMIQEDCSPWVPATHPDGGLYFYDEERRLFTDTDMHNTKMKDEIEHFYGHLQRILQNEDISIPSEDYDLVLDIMVTDDERISWSYYYACHEARCLFWLETYDASYMISELYGVKSPAHGTVWSPSIGRFIIYWIGVVSVDIFWLGIIGHSFRSFLIVVVFHMTFMTSLWGS